MQERGCRPTCLNFAHLSYGDEDDSFLDGTKFGTEKRKGGFADFSCLCDNFFDVPLCNFIDICNDGDQRKQENLFVRESYPTVAQINKHLAKWINCLFGAFVKIIPF